MAVSANKNQILLEFLDISLITQDKHEFETTTGPHYCARSGSRGSY
jgi:hypothetical protein